MMQHSMKVANQFLEAVEVALPQQNPVSLP